MRECILAVACVLSPMAAAAHPAVGIVVDSRGAVFYSDTEHVWRIDPRGRRTVAVPAVHTHELWLDGEDNLWGEHLRYVDGRWDHRIWRRSPDGTIANAVATRPGFREDYDDFFFVRDRRGAMYWLEGRSPAVLHRRTGSAPIETVARLTMLRDPVWLRATPSGEVLLSDYGVVWRISADGRVRSLSTAASRSRGRFAIMGLTEDSGGNIYVAAYEDRTVRRIASSGEVATIITIPEPWAPTGVAIGLAGELWVLEVSTANAQRVRRIERTGRMRVY